jgi:hypothetical protein
MKVERQSAAQIEEMVARSWVPMLRVIEGDEFISQS